MLLIIILSNQALFLINSGVDEILEAQDNVSITISEEYGGLISKKSFFLLIQTN